MKKRIGLIDVDSHNCPNLPLMKLSQFYKGQKNCEIQFYKKQKKYDTEWCLRLLKYDVVYVSKVFTFTPDIDFFPQAEEIVYGGSGYNLDSSLPAEIENICPDYSLYPEYKKAYGFLTRGCPKNCSWCIVSTKEGRVSRQVAELNSFLHNQKEIVLLDPNILACADSEKLLGQLAASNAWVDFTQGLDAKLVDNKTVKLLSQIKIKMAHFAWDVVGDERDIIRAFL